MYYVLNFERARSWKGLILSSLKGSIRSYFQSPKKRGHPNIVRPKAYLSEGVLDVNGDRIRCVVYC